MSKVIWTQRQDIGPDGRAAHAMAYDPSRQRTVLFGGRISGGTAAGDTWEWDGAAWTQVADTGPDPRWWHAITYGKALTLFGGDTGGGGLRQDTWIRDGGDWTQVADSGPVPRRGHAIAYDATRDRVVLFGGDTTAGLVGDTWEWDGTEWTQVQDTGPSPRADHAIAYDAARSRVVLYGGDTAAGAARDTWEWDGTDWTRVQDIGPPAALGSAMAFIGGSTLLIGGASSSTAGPPAPVLFGHSWEWAGDFWTDRADIGPRPRWAAALAFDADRGRAVLFGGSDAVPSDPNVAAAVLGDTWEAPFAGGPASPGGGQGAGAPQLTGFTISPDTFTLPQDVTFAATLSGPAAQMTEVSVYLGQPPGSPVLAIDIQPGQTQSAVTASIQPGMLPAGPYDLFAVLDAVTLTASMTVQ
jgi:hypothetical protein